MKNVFEDDVRIRYSEMDCNLVLKPSALLQFLQDLASENAESLGFGYSYIIKNNLAWFLLKYHMEFDNSPNGIYDLKIKTEPRGYNKIFAFRDFELLHNDIQIGRATSTWALVDLETKNMVNASDILKDNKYMTLHENREDDLSYLKIRQPQQFDIEKIYSVRFDYLDVNKHVNNANYIVWAFDTLDIEFRTKFILKTLDIVFKKEIKYGSDICVKTKVADNTTTHVLLDNKTKEEFCNVFAQWKALN